MFLGPLLLVNMVLGDSRYGPHTYLNTSASFIALHLSAFIRICLNVVFFCHLFTNLMRSRLQLEDIGI